MTPVRLEPTALRSLVKRSTTEPLRWLPHIDRYENRESSAQMAARFEPEHVIFVTRRNGKQPNVPVHVQYIPFIMLYLGSIRMDHVISE